MSFVSMALLNSSEAERVRRFCLEFLEPVPTDQALNAAYLLGDLETAPSLYEIALVGAGGGLSAVLLRRAPIYVPLGSRKAAFRLMAVLAKQKRYFIRIPPEWEESFALGFPYECTMKQVCFWMDSPGRFVPLAPPADLEVRMASTGDDIRALAAYYGMDEEEYLQTARSHPRVMGFHRGTLVCAARTNAVSSRYAVLGGVHTLRMFRGKGYAGAVSSRWTEEILRRRLIPLLETDVDNHPALHIYRKLGYRECGGNLFFERGSAIIQRLRSRA
jgi:GNAT superfamily N-acetyltransferase